MADAELKIVCAGKLLVVPVAVKPVMVVAEAVAVQV